jgi:hypothetical protein
VDFIRTVASATVAVRQATVHEDRAEIAESVTVRQAIVREDRAEIAASARIHLGRQHHRERDRR